ALGGVSLTVARAVGPAAGGLVVAASGPAAAFLLNALSFLGVLFVVAWWRRPREENALPTERLVGAMRAGVRYVRHSPAFRAVLVRASAYVVGASSLLALLPVLITLDTSWGPGGSHGVRRVAARRPLARAVVPPPPRRGRRPGALPALARSGHRARSGTRPGPRPRHDRVSDRPGAGGRVHGRRPAAPAGQA